MEHVSAKLDSGGIVDIAFVVQYLALAYAQGSPTLVKWLDVRCPLTRLKHHPLISAGALEAVAWAELAYLVRCAGWR